MTDTQAPPLFIVTEDAGVPGYVPVAHVGALTLAVSEPLAPLLAGPLRELAGWVGDYYLVPLREASTDGSHVEDGYEEVLRTPYWVVVATPPVAPLARALWQEALHRCAQEKEAEMRLLRQAEVATRWEAATAKKEADRLADYALRFATDPMRGALPEEDAEGDDAPGVATEDAGAAFKLALHLVHWMTARRGMDADDALAFLRENGDRALSLGWQRRDELLGKQAA